MKTNLYFDSKRMPPPKGEFIAWCDGMGTGRCLSRSLHEAANSVFKLHSAFSIAQSGTTGVCFYPVMDGVYITSPSRNTMNQVLRNAFCELAKEFVHRPGTPNMHMMRTGLAFGPVLHGGDIPAEAFFGTFKDGREIQAETFEQSPLRQIRLQVLLSPAMVLAYNAEKCAPPFGIYVDDTAKSYPNLCPNSDGTYISNLFQWWIFDDEAREIATALYGQILFYLSKAETHSVGMGYPIEAIRRHRELAVEYFGGLKKEEKDAQQSLPADAEHGAAEG